MKNLSLVLNAVLLAAIAHLYYLHFSSKPAAPEQAIVAPVSAEGGVKIAYVNADTLDAKYEWLKNQKAAIKQRIENANKAMTTKSESLGRDMAAFQQKADGGTIPPADLQKEYEALATRKQRLDEEAARLEEQLANDQRKAYNDLMTNVEAKLKTLQSQIGYDYILSYQKGGGQVLLVNDSLNITNEVLRLLNAKEEKK
jgi:outer membrane protein